MNFPSLTVKNASGAGILSAERWGAGSGGEPRWAPIYLMSPWSLVPQFVVAAPIFSYHINNETLGTRYLTEKLSTAGSRDETLTPLSVSLIFSPAVTATGRGRQIMSQGESASETVTAGGRSIPPGWREALGLCRRPGLPVRAPVCTPGSARPPARASCLRCGICPLHSQQGPTPSGRVFQLSEGLMSCGTTSQFLPPRPGSCPHFFSCSMLLLSHTI